MAFKDKFVNFALKIAYLLSLTIVVGGFVETWEVSRILRQLTPLLRGIQLFAFMAIWKCYKENTAGDQYICFEYPI